MTETVLTPGTPGRLASRYLACLRPADIVVLQGPPLLGAILALRHASGANLGSIAMLLVANVLLMAHVFLINDWAGLSDDLSDGNKAPRVFTARGVGAREIAALATGSLALSLVLFSYVGLTSLGIAIAIAILSALYSLPRWNWKGRPLLNSAAHLIGGVLHFLLGYSLGTVDVRGVAIGSFFALVFAAGHLVAEVRDHAADATNGIRTNAVAFGPARAFGASIALFTLAQGLLVYLAAAGLLPHSIAALATLYPLQLYWSDTVRREGFSFASVTRLQMRYRVLYGIIGVAMTVAIWTAA